MSVENRFGLGGSEIFIGSDNEAFRIHIPPEPIEDIDLTALEDRKKDEMRSVEDSILVQGKFSGDSKDNITVMGGRVKCTCTIYRKL